MNSERVASLSFQREGRTVEERWRNLDRRGVANFW